MHVSDVAHANILALAVPDLTSDAFNICSGHPKSILDMALALQPVGAPAPRVVGGFRLGDVRHIFASPNRATNTLGFTARVKFNDGMREFERSELRTIVGPRPSAAT